MSARVTARVQSAIAEYGAGNVVLLALHRLLERLPFPAGVERLHIVAQPVPAVPAPPARRGRDIAVRPLGAGDPALAVITRLPGELADRFAQGARCLGAFRGHELLGWLWFVTVEYRDFTHPVDFELHPQATTAWDFDVYVRPDARLTAAFARLWEVACDELRARGVRQSLSAISAYNPASLRAHRRLGMRPFGSLLVVQFGPLRAVLSRHFHPRIAWSLRAGFRTRLRVEAPPPTE